MARSSVCEVTEIAAALQGTRTVQEVRFGSANALAAASVLELYAALSRRALALAATAQVSTGTQIGAPPAVPFLTSVSKSVLYTLQCVKKCRIHST